MTLTTHRQLKKPSTILMNKEPALPLVFTEGLLFMRL